MKVDIDKLIYLSCKATGITKDQFKSRCQQKDIMDAKKICTIILRDSGVGYQAIADSLGYKTHSNIWIKYTMGKDLLSVDKRFQVKFNEVKGLL